MEQLETIKHINTQEKTQKEWWVANYTWSRYFEKSNVL